jgi:hypothetical protein
MDQIINEAIEVIKSAAPVAAGSIPFTGIVRRILGPAADEVAEMFRDEIRRYRYGRQLKCIEKAEKMAEKAGFTPNAVPPKILFPLLEGVSMEEDEFLHDMWAALLANASSPNAGKVRPGFVATLKAMAPDEAALLNHLFKNRSGEGAGPFNAPFTNEALLLAYNSIRSPNDQDTFAFLACLQTLEAERLVEKIYDPKLEGFITHSYRLTMRGLALVYACIPPTPKP